MNLQRKNLFRPEYDRLTSAEREIILRIFAETDTRFRFLRFEQFECFGMKTVTAVYKYGNSEFVFVPGDTVTLGWENFVCGMDEKTRADIQEGLEDYGIEISDLDNFIRESMSPVRQATISPMLVEREFNDIGWRQSELNSLEMEPFQKDIQEHLKKYQGFEIHKKVRIYRENDEITTEIYTPVSFEDFIKNIKTTGFSLPTEDEWEYLCGGGSRTLFRWGDSFDYDMNLHHFDRKTQKEEPYTLKKPNQFGISIAYDPYKYEVVENSEYFLKGGDGGCNICGGLGIALGYLPTATYFRSQCLSDDQLDYKSDIGGNYTYYRRIVRL